MGNYKSKNNKIIWHNEILIEVAEDLQEWTQNDREKLHRREAKKPTEKELLMNLPQRKHVGQVQRVAEAEDNYRHNN
jgi:hypothetical protein